MPDELITLAELFTHRGFLSGSVAGFVGLLTLYVASRAAKPIAAGWALALVVGAMVVLMDSYDVGEGFIPGLALLAITGAIVDLVSLSREGHLKVLTTALVWVSLLAAASWFTMEAGIPDMVWVEVAAPVVVLVIGWAIRSYRASAAGYLLGPMFALSVFGVWATVPETEMIRVVLGASIIMALATLPWVKARPMAVGAFPLAGLVVWLTATGGGARPASIVAGWAGVGVLLLIPTLKISTKSVNPYGLLGLHLVVVFVASRLLGSLQSAVVALAGVVVLLALAGAVLVFMTASTESASGAQNLAE